MIRKYRTLNGKTASRPKEQIERNVLVSQKKEVKPFL
jgi:hypothetical protein